MTLSLQGVICPTITPFNLEGDLDREFFKRHVEWLIERKISAIVTAGSTGEFPCLTKSERDELVRLAVECSNGRIDVIAGTGSTNSRETIELSRSAEKLGADAVMVITPYYFKASADALYQYYRDITESIDLPLIPYNNPNRAGIKLMPETVANLARDGLIAGYKDSGGNLVDTMEVISTVGDRISVIQGSDSLALPTYLVGGKGVISACSNVAATPIVTLYEHFRKNDIAKAIELQRRVTALDKLIVTSENYPEGIKGAMEIAGRSCGHARSVHVNIVERTKEQIRKSLQELEVI